MLSLLEMTLLLAVVGSGLVAGLCFTFASFLMRSFDDLGAPAAIRAMQALNARILRSGAMVAWIGTVFVGFAAVALAEERVPVLVGAVSYAVGALVITGRGNVPLNEELDRVDADAPGAAEAWASYRRTWGRWNALRTLLFAFASGAFALAL